MPWLSPMPHPGFAERWAVSARGDGLGRELGVAGSGALGQGVQGFLASWTSGFLGRRRGGEFRAERMLINLVEPLVSLDSHNTEGLFALIRLPVHLIINTFTH
jgi:hypothetical protein